jgi:hypothetical protein
MTIAFDEILIQIDRLTPAEQARLVEILAARLARTLSEPPAEAPTPEELGWPPGFFEQTAGSIPDLPERDDSGVDPSLDDDPDEIARQLDAIVANQDKGTTT